MTIRARIAPTSMKALVALLFATLFFFGLQAPSASADGDVDLTVNVTTKAGTALSGIDVVAYVVENHTSDYEDFVLGVPVSGKPGRYQLDGLDQDTDYALYFYVDNKNVTTFDQFYGGTTWVEDATLLRWDDAGPATLNASLATNTNITGKVSISSTKGLGGVQVTAYRFDGNEWYEVSHTFTSATGVYILRNLEPGSYRLAFEPDNQTAYLPRFSGGATSLSTALPIYAGLGTTTASNVSLSAGGRISGTVGLGPIVNNAYTYVTEGIKPIAYRMLGDSINGYHVDKSASYEGPLVGATGKWTIPGMPTGLYVVRFFDWSYLEPEYEPMWVSAGSGSDLISGAKIFAVTAGVAISAPTTVMRSTGVQPGVPITSIDVQVENAAHSPIEAADVVLVSTDQNYVSQRQYSDELGTARFNRVGEGAYRVEITTDNATTTYHPYIGTFTVSGTGDHVRTVTLAPVTAFSFTAPATVSWANTAVGSAFDVTVPPTTMDNGSGVEQDVSYRYQWYRGSTAIFGANDDTYVTKSGDLGSEVSVVVSASTFGFGDITEIAHAGAMTAPGVAAGALVPPAITSSTAAKPGVVLTAGVGTWDLTGLRYSYQWKRDGVDILNARSRTYALALGDANATITVAVVASRSGHVDSAPSVSAGVLVAPLPSPTQTRASVITAVTKYLPVGQVNYVVSVGTWSVAAPAWHVNWYEDGVQFSDARISGAGDGSHTEIYHYDPLADAGKLIQAVVVVEKTGYLSGGRSYTVRKGGVPTVVDPGGVTTPSHATPLSVGQAFDWGTKLTATPPQLSYPTMTGNTIARTYVWQRQIGTVWANIPKALASTYTTTTADINRNLRVLVTTTSSLSATHSVALSAGIPVLKWDIVGSAQPDIVVLGSNDAGTLKLAQVVGPWGAPAVTQTYQWYTCNAADPLLDCTDTSDNSVWKAVAKATAATWTPPVALAGQRIMLQVTASKSGYAPLTLRSDGTLLLAGHDEVSFVVASRIAAGLVAGNAVVGRAVTAAAGSVDTTGFVRSYRWQYSDDGTTWSDISGATALSWVPTAAFQDLHPSALIRFAETATKGALAPDTSTTPGVPLMPGTNVATRAPTFTGTAATAFTVNPGTWPAGTTFGYEWYLDETMVDTDAVYTPPPGSTSAVWVKVFVERPGYTDITIRLVPRKGTATWSAPPMTGQFVNDTFAGSPGFTFGMAAPEASYSYQWYSAATAIAGARSATFSPSSAYLGRSLTLRIALISPLYSAPVGVVGPVVVATHPVPAASDPVIANATSLVPGSKLVVTPGTYSTTGLALTYSIQRSVNAGATWTHLTAASSYIVQAADAGLQFRAVVTAKKAGWVTSVETSSVSTIGFLGPLDNVGPLAIAGTGAVGSVISVAPAWNTTLVTTTYTWLRNGVAIPGVTGAALIPLGTWLGDEIQVVVRGAKLGYQPVNIASNIVQIGAVTAAAPVTTATTVPVISGAYPTANRPKVTNVLAASTGVWNVDGLTFTYQWRAAGVDLPGATGANYTVTGAETGKIITVVVTATKPGYATGVSTSKPTLATIP